MRKILSFRQVERLKLKSVAREERLEQASRGSLNHALATEADSIRR